MVRFHDKILGTNTASPGEAGLKKGMNMAMTSAKGTITRDRLRMKLKGSLERRASVAMRIKQRMYPRQRAGGVVTTNVTKAKVVRILVLGSSLWSRLSKLLYLSAS
jgi:hypothetical protein